MAYLTKDIYSHCNPGKRYGYQGQEVNVISDHGGIFIVRPLDGSTGFHVMRDELTDMPFKKGDSQPASVDQIATEQKQAAPIRPSARGKAGPSPVLPSNTAQGSLF
ncbi:MAG: hypothetical protein BGO55_00745 [Sphingobacteriales bacterium 50-39]|nr:hypothetical protein [Sphingobacteriales bacterium]OJW53643.1 MAG: hypothetical protein BGO55_00745 [Sphingobacteriales bacterium 50-39]